MGLVFMSNQPSCVSWLGHLIHLHLKLLLIGMHFYCHFVNYFSGWFCSSFLFLSSFGFFPHGLMIFSFVFGLLPLYFLCTYYRLLVCGYHEVYIYGSISRLF